jgi:GT2 family glycosyltransferase
MPRMPATTPPPAPNPSAALTSWPAPSEGAIPPPLSFARHDVTAVLVTHDGERWVRGALRNLHQQRRAFQRLIVVDTGSLDRTREIVGEFIPQDDIVSAPRDAGFGGAVGTGLEQSVRWSPVDDDRERIEWVWLLHDDSEPAPDALHHLLAAVDPDDTVAVAGPKVRGWYRRRMLLEVGATIAGSGSRETGLERGEQDQGQHDGRRDVLAVGSAGMLVRRDVWDRLGGFDRALTFMRDDVDFCWRVRSAGHRVVVAPDAVVYHAEAAARERRVVQAARGRTHLLDRANAMYVLLANLPARSLPFTAARLFLGTLLRAVGFLVAKLPGFAVDEVLALIAVFTRPGALLRARRARKPTRTVPHSALRRLFPAPGHQARHAVEALGGLFSGRASAADEAPAGRHRAVESGPESEEAESLDTGGGLQALRRFFRRPGALLGLLLLLVTLGAARDLLFGGRLMGGALLPAPDGARDLWASYGAAWHAAGVGSAAPAPPYLAVVAALATLLLGKASLAVSVLLLGAVPLAGLAAYSAAGEIVRSRGLRVLAGALYALSPVMLGAVAAGRLGTAVAAVVLPLTARAALQMRGTGERPGSDRAAWATALGIAVMTAFVGLAWVLALLIGGLALATVARGDRDVQRRILLALLVPLVLLIPWSFHLIRYPSQLLLEAGATGPGLSDPDLSPWAVLALQPGGPGTYPWWISIAVLFAGFGGFLSTVRHRVIYAGWALALSGFAVALAVSRFEVSGPAAGVPSAPWPGLPLLVATMGLGAAAIATGEGALDRLATRSFGLVQPLAVLITAGVVLAAPAAAAWWIVDGAGDPLQRRDPRLVPPHVAAEATTPGRPRTLVLRPRGEDELTYALVRDAGSRLGDPETAGPRSSYAVLDGVVADLGSGGGGEQVLQRLADYAVRYVFMPAPADRRLSRTLDSVPGLTRVGEPAGGVLWRVDVPGVARLRLIGGAGEVVPVPSGRIDAAASVESSRGRLLVLSEALDRGWRATLDGQPLTRASYPDPTPWAQAFEVGSSSGGRLVVTYESRARRTWLLLQAVAVLVVLVLALPGGRRGPDDVDEESPVDRATRPARPEPISGAEPDLAGAGSTS